MIIIIIIINGIFKLLSNSELNVWCLIYTVLLKAFTVFEILVGGLMDDIYISKSWLNIENHYASEILKYLFWFSISQLIFLSSNVIKSNEGALKSVLNSHPNTDPIHHIKTTSHVKVEYTTKFNPKQFLFVLIIRLKTKLGLPTIFILQFK